jgi:hypothetical protein
VRQGDTVRVLVEPGAGPDPTVTYGGRIRNALLAAVLVPVGLVMLLIMLPIRRRRSRPNAHTT